MTLAGLAEDAGNFSAGDQDVVRLLHRHFEPGDGSDRVRARPRRDEGELGQALGRDRRAEQDRDEDARSRRRLPAAAEPATALGLLLGYGYDALAVVCAQEALRRRATLDVAVVASESALEQRQDDLRREGIRHGAYTSAVAEAPLGRAEIEAILPHREPFLLIDEVLELEPGARAVARKTVRPDEWYLTGHFPGRPVMPGVLIVEAMAQTGAVAVLSEEENRGRLALFAGIDGVRFKRVVEPGDELELTCELERVRGPIGRGKATATVDGQLAARGTLTFAVEGRSS